MADIARLLAESVSVACADRTPLYIAGSGSKPFNKSCNGRLLSLIEHTGIISYEPEELVLTARAGTPLKEIVQAMHQRGQFLPFEPPMFQQGGTLGGAVACGLSGPGRPWRGAARDLVLGVEMINGLGQHLRFGGQVMKNVAGYDISRLQTGAWGTLGVLLSVSIRVAPRPRDEITVCLNIDLEQAQQRVRQWAATALPVTATCHVDNCLWLRLSGAASAVVQAQDVVNGYRADGRIWDALRDQTHEFFTGSQTIWRLSLPAAAPAIELPDQAAAQTMLVEWGGALRWWKTNLPELEVQRIARQLGGIARRRDRKPDFATPAAIALKKAFDPHGILNPLSVHAD